MAFKGILLKAKIKRLQTVWFCLYNTLEKTSYSNGDYISSCQEVGVGRGCDYRGAAPESGGVGTLLDPLMVLVLWNYTCTKMHWAVHFPKSQFYCTIIWEKSSKPFSQKWNNLQTKTFFHNCLWIWSLNPVFLSYFSYFWYWPLFIFNFHSNSWPWFPFTYFQHLLFSWCSQMC